MRFGAVLVLAAILGWSWIASSACGADAVGGDVAPPAAAANDGIAVLDRAVAPMTVDLDAMRRLGRVRVLVSFSRTNFFVSEGRPRGFDCDLMGEYQRALLAQLKLRRAEVSIVFVPVPFEQLIPALLEGRGDIAAGGLTVDRKSVV